MSENTNGSVAPLELIVLTPHGKAADIRCDSVRLTLCDDENGRGGGSIGIHRGHLPAILALGDGPADAVLHGETVFHSQLHGGFASVRDNVVQIITDSELNTNEEK